MFRLLSFMFASDASEADPHTATVVPTGLQVGTSSTICKIDHLDELAIAITELLDQPADGVDDTEKTVIGGAASGADIVVKFTRATDLINVGAQVGWSRAKAGAFVAALSAFGMIAPAP